MKQEASNTVRSARHTPHAGEPPFYASLDDANTPAICSQCNAVFQNGAWQWSSAPIDSVLSHCPACTRIRQKTPAGYVSLQGYFAQDHRNEMLSLIHHIEKREKAAHPLKRIMWIEYQEDGMTITTTDFQLTRDIGAALLRTYKGDLEYHMNKAEELLYVRWYR